MHKFDRKKILVFLVFVFFSLVVGFVLVDKSPLQNSSTKDFIEQKNSYSIDKNNTFTGLNFDYCSDLDYSFESIFKDKNIVYYDSSCDIKGCDKDSISKQVNNIGLNPDSFEYIDIHCGVGLVSYLEENNLNYTPLLKLKKNSASSILRRASQMGSFIHNIDGNLFLYLNNFSSGRINSCYNFETKTILDYGKGCNFVDVVTDSRCDECSLNSLENKLTSYLKFGYYFQDSYDFVDYNDRIVYKKLLDELGANSLRLPVLLFEDVDPFLQQSLLSQGQFYDLDFQNYSYMFEFHNSNYRPLAEKCTNGKDDTFNGLIDCEDPTCESKLECYKSKKPYLEVFLTAQCPYGQSLEKDLIKIYSEFKEHIDIDIKYLDYLIKGQKEANEQLRQYCISKNYTTDELLGYLDCWLDSEQNIKDSKNCIQRQGLSYDNIESCSKNIDKKYKVTQKIENKTDWTRGYPPFDIHSELIQKYDIYTSPSLIIDEYKLDQNTLNYDTLKSKICSILETKPDICN